jgi:hypothetical protein
VLLLLVGQTVRLLLLSLLAKHVCVGWRWPC